MVRSFDVDRGVSRDQLNMLMNLAIRAPSAGHTQGWRFLVLDDITSRSAFWTATAPDREDAWLRGMRTAPALIVCYCDREAYLDRYAEPDKGWTDRDLARWPIPYWHVDTGMAAMIVLLGAQDAGLAACFFGVPGERWSALAQAFAVDQRLLPVGVIALGHAAAGERSRPLRRTRRTIDDIVRFGDAQSSD